MPELLSTQRPAAHGAQRQYATGLARSIAGDEIVRPRSPASPALATHPVADRPSPPRDAASPRPVRRTPAGSASGQQRAQVGARPGVHTLLRGTTASLGASQQDTPAILRTLMPAPPPVSYRPPAPNPARPAATRAAPVRQQPPNQAPAQPSVPPVRRSLVEATAELFRSAGLGQAGTIRRRDEGRAQAMTEPMSGNLPVRPDRAAPAAGGPAGSVFTPLAGDDAVSEVVAARHLDVLVDLVVERIEQRVVNELERRGQRHNPGVF